MFFPSPQLKKKSNFSKKCICDESCAYLKGKVNFRTWGEVLSAGAYTDQIFLQKCSLVTESRIKSAGVILRF